MDHHHITDNAQIRSRDQQMLPLKDIICGSGPRKTGLKMIHISSNFYGASLKHPEQFPQNPSLIFLPPIVRRVLLEHFHLWFSISTFLFWCLNHQRCEIRHHLGAIIGCHLFAATSESLGYLDPSGEGQVSRSEWGNLAVVRVGFLTSKIVLGK